MKVRFVLDCRNYETNWISYKVGAILLCTLPIANRLIGDGYAVEYEEPKPEKKKHTESTGG